MGYATLRGQWVLTASFSSMACDEALSAIYNWYVAVGEHYLRVVSCLEFYLPNHPRLGQYFQGAEGVEGALLAEQGIWPIADPILGEQFWTRSEGAFRTVCSGSVELTIGRDDLDPLRPLRLPLSAGGCDTCSRWLPTLFAFCPACGKPLPKGGYGYALPRINDDNSEHDDISLAASAEPEPTRLELPRGRGFHFFVVGNPSRLLAWEPNTGALYRWSATRPHGKSWYKLLDTLPIASAIGSNSAPAGSAAGQGLVLATEAGPTALKFDAFSQAPILVERLAPAVSLGMPCSMENVTYAPVEVNGQLGIGRSSCDGAGLGWSLLPVEGSPDAINSPLGRPKATAAGDAVWSGKHGFLGVRREAFGSQVRETARWVNFPSGVSALTFLSPSYVDGSAWQPVVVEGAAASPTIRGYVELNPRMLRPIEVVHSSAHVLSAGDFHFRKADRVDRPWDGHSAYAVAGENRLVMPLAQFGNVAIAHVSAGSSSFGDYLSGRPSAAVGDVLTMTLGSLRATLMPGVRVTGPYDLQVFSFARTVWIYAREMNELWGWAC